ncbi:MAG: hypothetical protein H7333_01845, partial [Bdellovibrionales bacterium]|nr:hypothetical protein [Oligoflexia bacterium]
MKLLWLTTALLALTACGPQAFVPSSASSSQTPAGAMNVPPKVDIVLGMSSNGTMKNILPGITSELPAFLEKLQNSGWDYRFVSIPLSEYHPTDNLNINGAVSVSKYDTNYPSGTWLPPFPGANHNTAPRVNPSLFAAFFNVSQFTSTDPNDAHESGFHNQLNFLYRNDVRNDFLRPDAMLAIITLSNGDDRSDWQWGPANTTDPGHPTVDSNTYANYFRGIKGSGSILKYYSLVSNNGVSCRGSASWNGQRYREMTGILSGASSDICTSAVADSLEAVRTNLSSVKLSFRK